MELSTYNGKNCSYEPEENLTKSFNGHNRQLFSIHSLIRTDLMDKVGDWVWNMVEVFKANEIPLTLIQ